MNELALFAGAGGGLLGSHLMGWKTVCAVEIEDYPRRVLLARQGDGHLPQFPIWNDVSTFDGKPWKGRIDIITGGFPCQDISCAGKGEGITGECSGLWGEMARIIGEIRPQYAFVENSPMLVRRGLAVVISDLAEMGYVCKWGIVGAHHAGGPHKRDRIWILANASNQGLQRGEHQAILRAGRRQEGRTTPQCSCSWWDVDPAEFPDTDKFNDDIRRYGTGQTCREQQDPANVSRCEVANPHQIMSSDPGFSRARRSKFNNGGLPETRWDNTDDKSIKSRLGRMADELADRLEFFRTAFGGEIPRVGTAIPNRCARLKVIGNGQVPMAHNLAVKILIGKESNDKKTTCMKCKKKIKIHWLHIQGIRLTKTIRGHEYYSARCPECGNTWNVLKGDGRSKTRTHTKDGRLLP